jgi:hypothetical protein
MHHPHEQHTLQHLDPIRSVSSAKGMEVAIALSNATSSFKDFAGESNIFISSLRIVFNAETN